MHRVAFRLKSMWPGRSRRTLAIFTALLMTGGVAVAVAATMIVTAKKISTYSAASSVPIKTCTLAPSGDSWVDSANNATNGGSTALNVQSGATLASNRRTFLRFDIASCSIASTAELKTSTLTLRLGTAPGSSRTHQLWRASAAWAEGTVTWGTQPGATNTSLTITTGTTNNVDKTLNVLTEVQAFVTGTTNNGWMIRDSSETQLGQLTTFAGSYRSKEYATIAERPQLEITYYD